MKKNLVLGLILTLGLGLFAGCTNSNKATTDTSNTNTEETVVKEIEAPNNEEESIDEEAEEVEEGYYNGGEDILVETEVGDYTINITAKIVDTPEYWLEETQSEKLLLISIDHSNISFKNGKIDYNFNTFEDVVILDMYEMAYSGFLKVKDPDNNILKITAFNYTEGEINHSIATPCAIGEKANVKATWNIENADNLDYVMVKFNRLDKEIKVKVER